MCVKSARMAKIKTPFPTSANPTCLLHTAEVENVLGRTRYTIDSQQGLTCIIADVGLGKTSILRYLWMDYKAQDDAVVAMIPTPEFPSPHGLLKAICEELRIPGKRSMQDQLKEFNAFVTEQHRRGNNVIIFIDEAQKLDARKLELIRTLLNFEKPDEKLVQIVLAGQLELRDRLIKKENEALYQRVYAPSLLSPLTYQDTVAMIEHRCKNAQIKNPFTDEALQMIYKLTGGVPRIILKLCGQAYEIMLRAREKKIDGELVEEVFTGSNLRGELKNVA